MKIEQKITVKATPQAVLEYLTSAQYIQDLNESKDYRTAGILSVTEAGRSMTDDQLTDQIIRYEAATRLPKFLKKYEAKAPETVAWQENYHWDRTRCQSTFNILADAPPNWKERYSTTGQISLIAQADTTQVIQTLEYKVNVFGLATIIERALAPEIESIFETRNKLIQSHFA